MSVYFIQAGLDGPVKIGWSRVVPRRLQELQRVHYEELRLLAEIPGGASREEELHAQFQSSHLRGEWFRPSSELLSFIENPTDIVSVVQKVRKTYKSKASEPHPKLVPLLEKHGLTHSQFIARGRPPSNAPQNLLLKRRALVTELHASGTPWADITEITGLGANCVQRLSDAMWNPASRETLRENGRVVGSRWKGRSRPGQLESQWRAGHFDRPETREKHRQKRSVAQPEVP